MIVSVTFTQSLQTFTPKCSTLGFGMSDFLLIPSDTGGCLLFRGWKAIRIVYYAPASSTNIATEVDA